MTARMRQESTDALYVLRELAKRGYGVTIEPPKAGLWSVSVEPSRYRARWFDGGTLDACLLQINLDRFPARAA